MPNSDYWKKRFELLEEAMNTKGEQYMQDTEAMYRKAIKETEKEISKWYMRYAHNENLTYQEAMRELNAKELKEFHWDVKEYIEKGKTLGMTDMWKDQLERASINVHITRLEALKLQMQQQVEELTGKKSKGINKLISDIYSDTFYKTAYEIQKGFGVGSNFAKLDKKQVEKILAKPWATDGSNFSKRIWGSHRAQLVNKLHEGLTLNLIQGKPPDKLISDIASTFHVDRKRAATLVYTEKGYFQSIAQRDSFEKMGVEEYEIIATLDSRTSEICQMMDGKHFKLKDWQIGVTAPIFHPRCRSAIAPYFDDEFEDEVKRAARDEDGKYYTVPAKMKYDEWYKAFVEGDKELLGKIKLFRYQDDEWLPFKINKESKMELINNDDEVVEEYFNNISLSFASDDLENAIKNDLKHMPIKDLEFIKTNRIIIVCQNKHSYYTNYPKPHIVLDLNKVKNGMFAHEFAHYVADSTNLYKNKDFSKILDNVMESITHYEFKNHGQEEYLFLKSELFVRSYQGRTYITKKEFIEQGYKFNKEELVEYISVGYETYITNPKLLYKKDRMLYDYIVKRGLVK